MSDEQQVNESRKVESAKNAEELSPLTKVLSKIRIKSISEIEFLLFGFAMMLGNRNSSWNSSLKYGYYSLLFNLLYAGSGYVCLCLCMGEMSSALPFSGGIFGFVRAALGPFNGFLVACCEFVYCTTYIVVKVQRLVNIFESEEDTNSSTSAGIIILIYGLCLAFNLIGGKPVFMLTSLIGFFTAMILLIYLLGTLGGVGSRSVSLVEHGGPWTEMTWASVMGARLAAGAQYNGMQYFPLLSGYLKEPREQVPRLLLITCGIFIVLSVSVSLAAISQAPGGEALVEADLPLKYGFARMFDISLDSCKWIEIPCLFGAVFGLFFCSGKQLLAITKSGLLPSFLDKTIPGVETPYLCYTLAAVVGAGLSIYALYFPENLLEIRAMSVLASFYIFVLCFVAYMVFRRKFSSMTRSFENPLGDGAAVYGIVNFVSAGVGLIFYTDADSMFLVGFGILFTLATIFFWTYLVKNQKFSEEEKKMMFKAYLINANRKSRQGRLKNNKVGPGSVSSVGSFSTATSRGNTAASKSHVDRVLGVSRVSLASPSSDSTPQIAQPAANQESNNDEENPVSSYPSLDSARQPPGNNPQTSADSGKIMVSGKIIAYLSGKLNAVAPLISNVSGSMDAEDRRDYEQLAVLSAGGVLEEGEEAALQARFGLKASGENQDEELRAGFVATSD